MKARSLLGILVVLVIVVVVAVVIVIQTGSAQKLPAQGSAATDPGMLLIPRWFLRELTVDGKKFDVPADQQNTTLQFVSDGTAVNGSGGCNTFGGSYQASQDGKMHFENVVSTLMACESGMDQESAYFSAMNKVEQFKIQDGKLILSSADGQTVLVFAKPPK